MLVAIIASGRARHLIGQSSYVSTAALYVVSYYTTLVRAFSKYTAAEKSWATSMLDIPTTYEEASIE